MERKYCFGLRHLIGNLSVAVRISKISESHSNMLNLGWSKCETIELKLRIVNFNIFLKSTEKQG